MPAVHETGERRMTEKAASRSRGAAVLRAGMLATLRPEVLATLVGLDTVCAVAPAPEPEFMTVIEAAEMLRVTTKTIHKMIRDGRLPAVRVAGGNRTLIRRRAVYDLLEPIQPEAYEADGE